MRNRIESASGRREEPLPTEIPRDEDHLITPRNLRAERAAAEIEHQSRKESQG